MPFAIILPPNYFFLQIFVEGAVINTPSMLCVEDFLDALNWADSVGGVEAMIRMSRSNLSVFEDFVATRPWIKFLPVFFEPSPPPSHFLFEWRGVYSENMEIDSEPLLFFQENRGD